MVHAHDGAHHGHVVAEVVGEQGADGPVNDAAGEDALLAGAALPAVEAAGNAAHGIQLLLKVHAQGEEVDAVPGTGRGGDAAQHAGLAVGDHNGGVGKLRQLAHLQGQGAARQVHGILVVMGELPVGDDGRHGLAPFHLIFPHGSRGRLALEKMPENPEIPAFFQLLKALIGSAHGQGWCERRVVRTGHTTLSSAYLRRPSLAIRAR